MKRSTVTDRVGTNQVFLQLNAVFLGDVYIVQGTEAGCNTVNDTFLFDDFFHDAAGFFNRIDRFGSQFDGGMIARNGNQLIQRQIRTIQNNFFHVSSLELYCLLPFGRDIQNGFSA